jgi:hypothetical protein
MYVHMDGPVLKREVVDRWKIDEIVFVFIDLVSRSSLRSRLICNLCVSSLTDFLLSRPEFHE